MVNEAVPGRLGHRAALDGLRGVSILIVMAFNAHFSFARGGFIGVDVFFVLSGFLITTLLIEEWDRTGTLHLKRFYIRRALRLLPALGVVIATTCLYAFLFRSPEKAQDTYRGSLFALFYVSNWMQAFAYRTGVGALGHAWSLSVEEQFYIVWPCVLFIMLLLRLKRNWILVILTLAIIGSGIWRALLWHDRPPDELLYHLRLYYGTDTRADALLIGSASGLLFSWGRMYISPGTTAALRLLAHSAALFLVGAVITVSVYASYMYYGLFTIIGLSAGFVLLNTVSSERGILSTILTIRPLVWIGRISYGLYLWHLPVFASLHDEMFGRYQLAGKIARFVATFAAAICSFYIVERPFLRLKKRIDSDETVIRRAGDLAVRT